jgi:alpha-amylase/alpha-mannosidase (GH57 family)
MTNKAVCIHGHFYQPPREDPLTGQIPREPGAEPFSNWNERILAHCYRPNASVGNFERISFNIGPTLAKWMDDRHPDVLEKIIEQDQRNMDRYGVGNAIAQPYHHTILPLATREDKETQVRWGIMDFKTRFGHAPMGMWLPETAVDTETLEVLAENGIQFTILAPWQAESDDLDVTKPYFVSLPEGKWITVFFYTQDLSTRISFDPAATSNADIFTKNLLVPKYGLNHNGQSVPELFTIASDGELYGHHQSFRDKFLQRLTTGAVKEYGIDLTFPALWLKDHPAVDIMSIYPNTSWSCSHGVERWRAECGCTPNGGWKAPLRQAFDRIARAVDEQYLAVLRHFPGNPWELRNAYGVVLSGVMKDATLIESALQVPLSQNEMQKIQILLAAQFERQRLYTSCAWFFDDFGRIEPQNNVAYAAQAVWLTYLATGVDLSEEAMGWLRPVKSWRTGIHADTVFKKHLDLAKDAAHNLSKWTSTQLPMASNNGAT